MTFNIITFSTHTHRLSRPVTRFLANVSVGDGRNQAMAEDKARRRKALQLRLRSSSR